MKIKRDYAVIILNYNVASDALAAAKSIIENATKYTYVIALVDNKSPNKNDVATLQNSELQNVEFFALENNSGYAVGNNNGIRLLSEKYEFEYVLIMNPDVVIVDNGTIDRLIDRLSLCDSSYCGIQPMIWTPYKGELKYQTHIRRIHSYSDNVVEHFAVFKRLFKKKYGKTIYIEERPYEKELDFEVPFGCFFIMRQSKFSEVGLFDERTFLYCEEMILAAKLKKIGCKFLFVPTEKVMHEGGKSTGSTVKRVKWSAVCNEIDSNTIFLKHYLKCNSIQIMFVK